MSNMLLYRHSNSWCNN